MLWIKPLPSPFYVNYISLVFAVIALKLAACAITIKLSLVVLCWLLTWYCLNQQKKKQIRYIKPLHLSADQSYLIMRKEGVWHLAKLQACSYLGRYILILNWQFMLKKQTASVILCRWHYDAASWRQYQLMLRGN